MKSLPVSQCIPHGREGGEASLVKVESDPIPSVPFGGRSNLADRNVWEIIYQKHQVVFPNSFVVSAMKKNCFSISDGWKDDGKKP